MTATIWKFDLAVQDEQTVWMPVMARVLSVANQHDALCLWAVVSPDAPQTERKFLVRGTGHPANGAENATFIGTVLMAGGSFVFHVFEDQA